MLLKELLTRCCDANERVQEKAEDTLEAMIINEKISGAGDMHEALLRPLQVYIIGLLLLTLSIARTAITAFFSMAKVTRFSQTCAMMGKLQNLKNRNCKIIVVTATEALLLLFSAKTKCFTAKIFASHLVNKNKSFKLRHDFIIFYLETIIIGGLQNKKKCVSYVKSCLF